jgi:hypothetical protein
MVNSCIPVLQEKVRAEVWMGDTLLAKTPFVRNFSITSSRSQISNTCSVTFEMIAGQPFPLNSSLVIKAGTKGNEKDKFTGFVESSNVQPSFGKPSYFQVTLSARGVLSQLENKKFSRRLRADGQGLFCTITGGASNRPESFFSLSRQVESGNRTTMSRSPNPTRANGAGEHSPLILNKSSVSATDPSLSFSDVAERPTKEGGDDAGAGAGAFRVHTHENLDEGGPAFAVYSSD